MSSPTGERPYRGLLRTHKLRDQELLGEKIVVQLNLTDDEIQVLRDVLESYLSDLRMEIADTDSMDFREMLKQRKQILVKVLDALPKSAPS